MGFFSRLLGLFSQSGRDDGRLLQGLELAKSGEPQKAIELYNQLLDSQSVSDIVRARALFNRALAHSALKHDEEAAADLQKVLSLPGLPENVQSAARTQLARV